MKETTEEKVVRPLDWMQRCCYEGAFHHDMQAPRTIIVGNVEWTVACDGRRLIAFEQSHGYPPIENRETARNFANIIAPPVEEVDGYKWISTDYETLREFIGEPHDITPETCRTCYGDGEVECEYGHIHDCPECEDGKAVYSPPERVVKINELYFNAVLIAETMCDSPSGKCALWMRPSKFSCADDRHKRRVGMYVRSPGRVAAIMDLDMTHASAKTKGVPEFTPNPEAPQ